MFQGGASNYPMTVFTETDLHVTGDGSVGNPIGATTFVSRRLGGEDIAASTAAIGNTETVVMTAASIKIENGRAYRVEFNGTISNSVANTDALFRVRKTNAAGTQMWVSRTPCRAAVTSYTADFTAHFTATSDTTIDVVLTLQGSAAHTAAIAAGAFSPATFTVYDDGYAASYPNCVTMP
jgi:hypothetical protein